MTISKQILAWPPISGIVDILFPPVCLCCHQFIDDGRGLICSSCRKKIVLVDKPYCLKCRLPMEDIKGCVNCSRTGMPPVFSLGHYIDPLKEMVHQFKFHGFRSLGRELAEDLAAAFLPQLRKVDADGVVPIPLHSYREKRRGFNQAAEIADVIARSLCLPLVLNGLVKIKIIPDQAKQTPAKRAVNVIGAFAVEGNAAIDKKIILVDDVITTGATISEAAAVLTRSGGEVAAICTLAAAGL
jgi:ComF family protein